MADKILVVEDEVSLQETLAYNLKKQGYEVETVGDGLAALDKARQAHPDLIVLDIMLPGLDGFEVARILRQEMKQFELLGFERQNMTVAGHFAAGDINHQVSKIEALAGNGRCSGGCDFLADQTYPAQHGLNPRH